MAKKKSDKQPVIGNCALCKTDSTLELSHIIPDFVFRYLKKHSFTGRFRPITDPNLPVQGGLKIPLLCPNCEDLFNKDETTFSNRIFHPFKKGGLNYPIIYNGDWLNRFATSVSWRIFYRDLKNNNIEKTLEKPLSLEASNILNNAEKVMRSYLLKERMDLGAIENHIIFFNEEKMRLLFNNPHAIILGTIFGTSLVISEEAIYVISNLVGILIITIIQKHPNERWFNTIISNKSGEFTSRQSCYSPIIDELKYLENVRRIYKERVSKKQIENLADKIRKNPSGFKNSETYKRYIRDEELK